MKLKYLFVALIISAVSVATSALAVGVNSPNPILTVKQGDVADFTIVLTGEGNVRVDVTADLPVTPAEKTIEVLNDIYLRYKMRIRGLKRAKRFTWEKTAAGTWRAIEEAVG